MLFGLSLAAAGSLAAQGPVSKKWTAAAPAVAERFEPELVARGDTEESMLSVSPDGSQIFWGVSRLWFPMTRMSEIWTAKRENGRWLDASRAPFSIGFSDGDPFVSYDGKQIFFVSMRPVGPPRKDFDLYVVDRGADGTASPKNLGPAVNSPQDEFYPSVAGDGTLYFASERSGEWKIYRSRRAADGSYGAAELLPGAVNQTGPWSFNPFITKDGKTLLFTSLNAKGGAGKGDIWVATAEPSGAFGAVRNLGPSVNTAEEEFHPTLSPDKRALFFIRRNTSRAGGNADVYWMRTDKLGL
jgi:Tol biopolymer transport system component